MNKIKEKREKAGLRQVDLATLCGVGIGTIWLIENGYDKRTSKKTKDKIAAGLKAETKELFSE